MNTSRKTTDDLLRVRREKAERLKAQIAALEERKKTEDRRRDVRRKIVVGAAVLAHAEADAIFCEALRAVLRSAVARDADKMVVADLIEG